MEYYRKLISKMSNINTKKAKQNIDMYDGRQYDITAEFINRHSDKRIDQKKQYIVRTDNITKRIIESSGMLFINGSPSFVAKDKSGQVDENATAAINQLIDYDVLQSVFAGVDTYTRLLGSCGMLFGYDPESNKITIDVIHHANSYIMVDSKNRIETLIRLLSDDRYEIWTKDKRVVVKDNRTEVVIESQDENTFGVVPVVIMYDSTPPLYGGPYCEVDTELTNTNLAINKMVSDLQYNVTWASSPTLFMVGCSPSLDSSGRQKPLSTGPESVIMLSADGNSEVAYKAPVIDIESFNNNIRDNIKSAADKYGVRTDVDTSNITSGFSLIVREIRTLEIRTKRQRAFESCIGRDQKILKTIFSMFGITFGEDVNIVVEIPKSELPVDDMAVEQVWTERINQGRATVIDYLIEVKRLSPAEAENKLNQIREEKLTNMIMVQNNMQNNMQNNQSNTGDNNDTVQQ